MLADALDALRAALAGQELLGQELVVDAPGGLAERIIGPLARAALAEGDASGISERRVPDIVASMKRELGGEAA